MADALSYATPVPRSQRQPFRLLLIAAALSLILIAYRHRAAVATWIGLRIATLCAWHAERACPLTVFDSEYWADITSTSDARWPADWVSFLQRVFEVDSRSASSHSTSVSMDSMLAAYPKGSADLLMLNESPAVAGRRRLLAVFRLKLNGRFVLCAVVWNSGTLINAPVERIFLAGPEVVCETGHHVEFGTGGMDQGSSVRFHIPARVDGRVGSLTGTLSNDDMVQISSDLGWMPPNRSDVWFAEGRPADWPVQINLTPLSVGRDGRAFGFTSTARLAFTDADALWFFDPATRKITPSTFDATQRRDAICNDVFSPNGQWLFFDKGLAGWALIDLNTQRANYRSGRTLFGPEAAFSSSGDRLVLRSSRDDGGNQLDLLNVPDCGTLASTNVDNDHPIACGRRLLAQLNAPIQLFDDQSLRPGGTVPADLLAATVAISPDDKRIAIFSMWHGVEVRDCVSGKVLCRSKPNFWSHEILMYAQPVFSRDGRWLAYHGESKLFIVDIPATRHLLAFSDSGSKTSAVTFSQDGQWLATGADRFRLGGPLKLWRMAEIERAFDALDSAKSRVSARRF